MHSREIIGDLLRRASLTAPDLLAADIGAALQDAGGNHLVLYVVDYEQLSLQPVGIAVDLLAEEPKGVNVEGTLAGRAFQLQEVVSTAVDGGWRVWAPVRERAERIGVIEFGFAELDDELLALCDDLGLLAGHLVHTAGRYTDLVELRRRRRPMNLAAEMQWDMLMPPLAFSSPELAIAGILEPAYFVAGDAFDYSMNGELFSFAILDAMGHGVHSTLASTLALGGFRHGRRRGLDLAVIAEQMDDALVEHLEEEEGFVTGHICQLDVGTGGFRWVNAGHPPPLLVRGSKVVGEMKAEPCLPLGLGIDVTHVGEVRLQPGDRVLFYSDGVVEARPKGGPQFGVERLIDDAEEFLGSNLPVAEVLRRLVRRLREHRGGELEDDATLVFMEWQPAPGRPGDRGGRRAAG
ncbi:MAG: Serine phosphatase RsbU, regulator of sigma subunit [uncultured Acidimicrobiales bacterium]|uniref:Serine phosphatase RsbU, regulator of sigma subunit n=1 Tax=uncultured Acidimicrobiales bacterium TaxID=310071 RepID=A0A6J4H1M7_9ACTN|nr:MAG: Serine phosphatase RsbU, regulator of sigma subunit [uncultured Acidimicrobiales bacterium]